MSAPAKVIELDLHRREPTAFGWSTLRMINSSPCKRDAIRMYARLGLHPILIHGVDDGGACTCRRRGCAATGKHPVARGWQSAALDLAVLDTAFVGNFRYNVGLRMGRQPSGVVLICIDVDGPRSLLEPIEREEETSFPPTLTAETARGLHFIYNWSDWRKTLGNSVRFAPKVDVRAARGQIVAPPSRHASGVPYRWIDAREPVVLP